MNKAAFHTLGCKVNQVDTAAMETLFRNAGYEIVAFDEIADVYVINTCTVTNTGDKKSRQAIRQAVMKNPAAVVAVTGCYAQTAPEECRLPGVRVVLGNRHRQRIVELVERAWDCDEVVILVGDMEQTEDFCDVWAGTQDRTRAFLKIQEGCRQFCSYCIIPQARGPLRSRPIGDIQREAETLAARGFGELVLTGIHLSSYHDGQNDLADVVLALEASPVRVRLGSLEPRLMSADFIDKLSKAKNLCRHFHLALQSGCDRTLVTMNRHYTTAQFAQVVERIRKTWPGAALTTDVMVGMPGENDADFFESMAFVKEMRFAKLHVFPYSPRKGTAAAAMEQLPKQVRTQRAAEMGALGDRLEREFVQGLVGETDEVLLEEADHDGMVGCNDRYVRVWVRQGAAGTLVKVKLSGVLENGIMLEGQIIDGGL